MLIKRNIPPNPGYNRLNSVPTRYNKTNCPSTYIYPGTSTLITKYRQPTVPQNLNLSTNFPPQQSPKYNIFLYYNNTIYKEIILPIINTTPCNNIRRTHIPIIENNKIIPIEDNQEIPSGTTLLYINKRSKYHAIRYNKSTSKPFGGIKYVGHFLIEAAVCHTFPQGIGLFHRYSAILWYYSPQYIHYSPWGQYRV